MYLRSLQPLYKGTCLNPLAVLSNFLFLNRNVCLKSLSIAVLRTFARHSVVASLRLAPDLGLTPRLVLMTRASSRLAQGLRFIEPLATLTSLNSQNSPEARSPSLLFSDNSQPAARESLRG